MAKSEFLTIKETIKSCLYISVVSLPLIGCSGVSPCLSNVTLIIRLFTSSVSYIFFLHSPVLPIYKNKEFFKESNVFCLLRNV